MHYFFHFLFMNLIYIGGVSVSALALLGFLQETIVAQGWPLNIIHLILREVFLFIADFWPHVRGP